MGNFLLREWTPQSEPEPLSWYRDPDAALKRMRGY
jgi:hypothetical protein